MHSRDITIPADDGFPLAATCYEPAEPAPGTPVVIIGAATAVPRRFYAQFALYLVGQGHPVITFDYRGVSQSRPRSLVGFHARMRDWGILDIPGVLGHADRTMPGRPILWVGNSYGGFGPGLAHNNHLIVRLLSVSSMSAYLGNLPPQQHIHLNFLMSVPMQLSALALGYFPGRLMGGEDLPKGVALEWSRWCRARDFLFGDDTLPEKANFAHFTAPIRFAYAEDDAWISRKGVEQLATRFPNARETSLWKIRPADVGAHEIGHVGFFKPRFSGTLWPQALAWLNEAAARV